MSVQRLPSGLRATTLDFYPTQAAGSVMITQGHTQILCTASLDRDVPRWMRAADGTPTQGWVTAEYAMLPGSTNRRKKRGVDSRATEIRRLIGRALRAAVDLSAMPGLTITCDCDVLRADGGTRTASITGAYVALAQALHVARQDGLLDGDPLHGPITAVSVGLIEGHAYLDLDYALDSRADVDMNVAVNHRDEYVELQATGEGGTLARPQLNTLLDLADAGVRDLRKLQTATLARLL